MRFFLRRSKSGTAIAFSFVASAMLLATGVASGEDAKWSADLAAWRAHHASELQKPAGWLSLTGLDWLEEGDNTFGSAPDNKIKLVGCPAHLGVLHLENQTVQLLPPKSGEFVADFLVDGAAAKKQLIPVDPDNDKNAPHLTIGSLNMYVIRRAERFALRVKDSKSPALLGFHGLKW